MFFRIKKPKKRPPLSLLPSPKVQDFLMPFLKRHQVSLIIFSTCVMIASSIGGIVPYLIKLLVDNAHITEINHDQFIEKTIYITIGIVLCRCCVNLFWFISDTAWANLEIGLGHDVRLSLMAYLHDHGINFFEKKLSGDLSQKVLQATNSVRSICEIIILDFGYIFFRTIVALTMLFFAHVYLGLAVAITLIFITIGMFYLGKRVESSSESRTDIQSQIGGYVADSVVNARLTKLFVGKKHELKYLTKKSHDLMRREVSFYATIRNTDAIKLAVETLIFLVCLVTSVILYVNGDITFGTVIMAVTYGLSLMDIFYGLSSDFMNLSENIGNVRSSIKAILVPTDVNDHTKKKVLRTNQADVCLDQIMFKYDQENIIGKKQPFSLNIPSQQKVAIVGPSGAGKSTLVHLILRFYDVTQGKITIDGQDIKNVTQESLRKNISVIPQDTSLFHRSLMDNIRYGRLGATDKEVIAAAKKAHAHAFIKELPNGYDTLVGERGLRLSGGQRQRIAIARAILKDAPILILDEATSALDSESEQAIQSALKKIMKNKTVIAIAHRLSTIAHMDRVIVMDQGAIVEDGDHTTLIKKKNGLYAKLWQHQSGDFIGQI